jgi:hypothetical protein
MVDGCCDGSIFYSVPIILFRPFKASDRPEGRVYLFGYSCTVLTSSGTSIWLILNPLSIAKALLRLSSPLYNATWSELRGPIVRELVAQALLLGAKVTGSGLPGSSWAPSRLALLASRACYTTQLGQSCEVPSRGSWKLHFKAL